MTIDWWRATLADGTEITSSEADSIARAHERGVIKKLDVAVDGRPPVHVACAIELGERLALFTRRAILNVGTPNARAVDMPVIELRKPAGDFVRLYFHPEHGLVLSSLDLNL